MVSFLCRLSFNPHFKNKAHGLRFVASWYCDSCSVVLWGVQFVLFSVFTLLFPRWHFWPPAARFRSDFKWGEKIMSKYWLVWRPRSSPSPRERVPLFPALVDLCQSLKYLGSYTQEVHTTWLVEGNTGRLKNGKSYRWEPQASQFESHNRTPSRLTLQACVAVRWRSQKIWGIGRLIPAERKFPCGVTRTSCCLMTPNTLRDAWPPSFRAQLLRSANKLSWLHLRENSGSVSFLFSFHFTKSRLSHHSIHSSSLNF